MTYTITNNPQFNSLEITFDGKPSEAVRNALKELKFRWHSVKRCWYGYSTEEAVATAITSTTTDEEPASVIGDGYMGGGSFYGSKSHKHLYGADLSAAIRADLKAVGIKGATVKCHTYSGGQNIRITYKAQPGDFVSLQEFIDGYRIKGSTAWIYFGSGAGEFIHCDKYWALDGDERERIRTAAAAWEYEKYTQHENNINHYYLNDYGVFTEETRRLMTRIAEIVCAYNYDNSNGMVDYFDTNFYWDLEVKPAAA